MLSCFLEGFWVVSSQAVFLAFSYSFQFQCDTDAWLWAFVDVE